MQETLTGVQIQAEEATARERVSCLMTDLDRLGRETADASAEHAEVSVAVLEAQEHLSHLQAWQKPAQATTCALNLAALEARILSAIQ